MKKTLALLLAALLCLTAVSAAAAEKPASWELIEKIVVLYGANGEAAADRISELHAELETVDADAARKWGAILQLWHNDELTVNEDILPDGLPDTDELCLVALGFQLAPDGSMKEELIHRLETVKRSAEKYPNAVIVCTGGGTARDNPAATEAGEMAKWLKENGIDASRIFAEDKSQTTAQNAVYTLDLLQKECPQVRQLAIISQRLSHCDGGAAVRGGADPAGGGQYPGRLECGVEGALRHALAHVPGGRADRAARRQTDRL